jgi:hypothetical protein
VRPLASINSPHASQGMGSLDEYGQRLCGGLEMMEILLAVLFVLVSYSLYCTYTGEES